MLHDNNFENDFDATIADIKIKADQLYSKYVYSDIDNRKQNPILKLLFAIDNIKSVITATSNIAVLIIIYHSKNCLIFLNNWENSSYFSATFSILFPFTDGGY